MLSAAITTNASLVATADRNGRMPTLSRSASAQRTDITPEQGSATIENYQDKVTLSDGGVDTSRQTEAAENQSSNQADATNAGLQKKDGTQTKTGDQTLTPAEEQVIQQLKARDREVKTHELAHLASAGQYARGGPSYSYQLGPDGQQYAIGGEVPIDISTEKTPEQTIQKMQVIERAAMAPADPSSADRSIAAAAAAMEAQARQEIQNAQADAFQKQGQSRTESRSTRGQTLHNNAAVSDSVRRTEPLDIIA